VTRGSVHRLRPPRGCADRRTNRARQPRRGSLRRRAGISFFSFAHDPLWRTGGHPASPCGTGFCGIM